MMVIESRCQGLGLAQDQASDAEEPIDASDDQRLEGAVVASLGRFDESSCQPRSPTCADDLARVCHL